MGNQRAAGIKMRKSLNAAASDSDFTMESAFAVI